MFRTPPPIGKIERAAGENFAKCSAPQAKILRIIARRRRKFFQPDPSWTAGHRPRGAGRHTPPWTPAIGRAAADPPPPLGHGHLAPRRGQAGRPGIVGRTDVRPHCFLGPGP